MKRDGVLDELSKKWFSNYLSAEEQKAADEAAKAASSAAAEGEAAQSDASAAEETGGVAN